MKKASAWSLIIFGLVWGSAATLGFLRGSATDDWPSTGGAIVTFEIKKAKLRLARRHAGHGLTPKRFVAHMTYAYQVDGQRYAGKYYHINFLGLRARLSGGSRHAMQGVLDVSDRFAPGQPVTVYYDPDSPGTALLEKGYRAGNPAWYIGAGLVAIAIGTAQLLFRGS